jgi:hypothetical protein
MTTIKPVFLQLARPHDDFPGHVIEGFFTVQDDTVLLVDQDGTAVKDADGATFSRKLVAGDNPKAIAHRLLRAHYSRRKSVSGFNRGRIHYPKTGWR